MKTGRAAHVKVEALRPIGGLALRLMAERGWRWLLTVGLALLLAGVAGLCGLLSSVALERRFARDARTATAAVQHVEKGWRGGFVYYTFVDDEGRTRRGSGGVHRERGKAPTPGGELTIRYLPGETSPSRPADAAGRPIAWALAAVPLALVAMGAAALRRVVRHAATGARLIADGARAQGTIDGKPKRLSVGWRGCRVERVRYTFDLPDGGSQSGEDVVVAANLAGPINPGKPVDVLYMPDDPSRSKLFRKHWRRDHEARRQRRSQP